MSKLYSQLALLSLIIFVASTYAETPAEIFLGENQEPGYITISQGNELFYWLFKSRNSPDTDPLVFWLTGGPGCSSEVAVFYENGPFFINENLSLRINENSWNEISNMVYIDQPVGTGFSTATRLVTNEGEIAADFFTFLLGFMDKYPEFISRPLYITGESYAGHYIPAIASYIVKQADSKLNLKGVAIGNGLVDPYNQYPAYATFSYENKLVSKTAYEILKLSFAGCDALISTGIWLVAEEQCQLTTESILGNPLAPRFNVYDIREPCTIPPLCYNFSLVDDFLVRPDVIEALGVEGKKWTECSTAVHTALLGDWMLDLSNNVTYLIEQGVFVFVYSGDQDFICNWVGGETWTNAVQWDKQQTFQNESYQSWGPDGSYGQYRIVDNFAFVRVYNAGHMVPMNQPVAALYMFENFLENWKDI